MKKTILMENKQTGWRVVIPAAPAPVVLSAAREFVGFFSTITGVTLPMVSEAEPAQPGEILIGTETRDFAAKAAFDGADLGNEGYFYAVEEDRIFIGGKGERGTLYGVYTFLEDELGCRWFTETLSVIPETDTVAVEQKLRSYVPPMHYRSTSFRDGMESMYCVRNKLNAQASIPAEYGGTEKFGIGFVHTLHALVPDSLYDEHPEYFPLIDGQRQKGPHHQRCLTHPDVLAMTIEKVKNDFRKYPDHRVASVSQADTYPDVPNACTCDACRAINEAEGSLMGTQLRFVNAVADAVAEEFPDRYIETLAYRFTRKRPAITRPRKNVIIRLCSIECCFSHPIDECGHDGHNAAAGHVSNPEFVRDMQEWAEISDNIYIWDYVTNFAHYLAPQPNLHVLGSNMRFFVRNKTVGIYPEGAHNARGTEMSELKSWILAKLEWDPDFDVEKGTEEFIAAYCGAGAEPILRYVNALNQRAEDIQSHRTCYAAPDVEFFSPEFMAFAFDCFAEAKLKAENDAVLERIQRWEMSIRYIDLMLYHLNYTDQQLEELLNTYFDDMTRLEVTQLQEGGGREGSLAILQAHFRNNRPHKEA